jgi:hypothetical protein
MILSLAGHGRDQEGRCQGSQGKNKPHFASPTDCCSAALEPNVLPQRWFDKVLVSALQQFVLVLFASPG